MIYPWNRAHWVGLHARPSGLPTATLLSGPRGVGKRSFAQALAMATLCSARTVGAEACGTCRSCLSYAATSHPDLRFLEPAPPETAAADTDAAPASSTSSRVITVDRIRDLSSFLAMSPHYGQSKTVVIQPADKLHLSAANALLKTLEEPPARTLFILVTDRPQLVLPTIRSRCYRLDFAPPSAEIAGAWLRERGIEDAAIALAQSGNAPLAAEQLVNEESWKRRRVLNDLLARREVDAGQLANQISADELPSFWGLLYRWCYDLMELRASGSVRYNPDYIKSLGALAANMDLQRLHHFMKELLVTGRALEHPLNPRLVCERLAIGYARTVEI